jgi:hypothetical protein
MLLNDDTNRQNWKTNRTDQDEFCRILIKTVRNNLKKVRYFLLARDTTRKQYVFIIFGKRGNGKVSNIEVLDFLMGYESDEYRSQVGATNRPENIVIR